MRKIFIGSDHAGFQCKEFIKEIYKHDIDFQDFGAYSEKSMDYPDVVHPLCQNLDENGLAILICGSGNGVCMTANKYPYIRAALAWNHEIAALARLHNNANVLCIPARFISETEAIACVKAFIETEFEGGRHQTRVNKISI